MWRKTTGICPGSVKYFAFTAKPLLSYGQEMLVAWFLWMTKFAELIGFWHTNEWRNTWCLDTTSNRSRRWNVWVLTSAAWRAFLVRTRELTYELQHLALLSRFAKHDCKQVWNKTKVFYSCFGLSAGMSNENPAGQGRAGYELVGRNLRYSCRICLRLGNGELWAVAPPPLVKGFWRQL